MSKKAQGKVKLILPAGNAKPPIPILGQRGVNGKTFCDLFNSQTKNMPQGDLLPVEVLIFEKGEFEVSIKSLSTTARIKRALGLQKSVKMPGREKLGVKLNRNQLESIAKEKMVDTNSYDLEAMCRMVAGTAKSMGIEVENE